jgi:hypothetical protein
LPSSGGDGRIVAIVGAYDAPNAEADLAVYRKQFGLPPCTSENGCFTKVNQEGKTSPLPPANGGWAAEMALDLDMASATCPDCRLLLVEARSPNIADLGPAVVTAANMGASAISNSYGSPEVDGLEATSHAWYDHPGVLVTASTGDAGYGVSFPASAPHVLAVGGTTLVRSGSSRGWAETAWRSGGSGCSQVIAKPPFQTDTGCPRRMNADVAAVADAATSVAVYNGQWYAMGGTSASAPIVAGIFTLFDIAKAGNAWPYEHATSFFDITSGSNGKCDGAYPCTAGPGYDGPTGMGTPNGELLATEASTSRDLATEPQATPASGGASRGCSVAGARDEAPRAWLAVALGSILAGRRLRRTSGPTPRLAGDSYRSRTA